MAATRSDISEWFDAGKKMGEAYMIVVCSKDDECYPVCTGKGTFWVKYNAYAKDEGMWKIMAVYNLAVDKWQQLNQHRVFNVPERN